MGFSSNNMSLYNGMDYINNNMSQIDNSGWTQSDISISDGSHAIFAPNSSIAITTNQTGYIDPSMFSQWNAIPYVENRSLNMPSHTTHFGHTQPMQPTLQSLYLETNHYDMGGHPNNNMSHTQNIMWPRFDNNSNVGHIDYDWSNIDNRTGSISFGSQETQMEQSTARYHAANNNQFSEQTDRSDFISQPATGVVLPPNNTALDDAEYEAFCASSLDFKNCI